MPDIPDVLQTQCIGILYLLKGSILLKPPDKKAPITTATDGKLTSFQIFEKKGTIFHENRLPASENIIPYLLFLKKQQNLKLFYTCRWRFMGLELVLLFLNQNTCCGYPKGLPQ